MDRSDKRSSWKDRLPRNENGIVLLSGGNPQIPKGDGDAPVQLYIANMPGWKATSAGGSTTSWPGRFLTS